MYGGYGGKNADSPSERGGRFGGGGLGSPSKSASKSSSSASKAGSTGSARSDTPSSNRSKGGLGTASKASKDTASKAAVGSSVGSLAGRTRMGSVERASTPKAADRAPATGFSLQGRTRMESVTRPARSPGFENKSSVPARSVPTQSFTPSSPASTVPQSVMDRKGFATSYPTGFDLKGRTRMSSMGDMATARAADRRSVAGYSGATATPATKGLGASVGDMDMAQQRRATENQSMDQLNAINGILGAAGKLEARQTDPYNGLVYGGVETHAPLTDMTIREVVEYQSTMLQKGHPTTAVGAYQMVTGTLQAAMKRMGFTPDTKFTPAVQDALAMDLVYNRLAKATKNGVVSTKDFVNQLKSEWNAFNKTSKISDKQLTSLAQSVIDSGLVGNDYTPAVAGTGDDFETRAPEMAGDAVPTPPADQTFPDAPTPPRNVLNLPRRAPKPTARDAPPYKRSGLGTVMAGGLDLLSSMGGIPALVGQGLSFVTTGKSLGENVVDYVSQNENYFQPGEGTDAPGYGDPERLTADFLETRKKIADKKAKAEEPTYDFVEKYIEFENTSGRPTPEQKWDWRSSKYIGVT